MKTKIVIEDGRTEIILTPENSFERDAIENMEHKQLYTTIERINHFDTEKSIKIIPNEQK